jgi:hypothetical protein
MKKQRIALVLLLLLGTLGLNSCKKDNSDDGHHVKFTLTVTGGTQSDRDGVVTVLFGGLDANYTKNLSIWKVNGNTRDDKVFIQFDGGNFPDGQTTTYTVESTTAVNNVYADLSFVSLNDGSNYKVSFKAEVDGHVQTDDENVDVSFNNPYVHNYTY